MLITLICQVKRPLFVFLEPFPVGVVVTLISALVLRRKQAVTSVPPR